MAESDMKSGAFLAVQSLGKSYPGVTALSGVDLEFRPGEVTALVGKNGAGKSTLIKILAGAVQPDEGRILLDGEPVVFSVPSDATERGLAFVHQELSDVPQLSVAENVLLGLGLPKRGGLFVDWRSARRRAAEILADLDDRIRPEAPVSSLSVAQRRLVMIARALAHDSRLLVLDEPTAALTMTEIDHLHDVVRRVASRGMSVVYVSHRLGEVFALTDRTVVMRDGMLVADRPTSEYDARTLVEAISGGTGSRSELPALKRTYDLGDVVLRARGLARHGVVHGVDLEVRAGEVVGIAGLVGAGRTEMVRLLVGADARSAGEIEVNGRPAAMRSPREAADRGVVLLPEDRRNEGAVINMTIRENITLPSLSAYRRSAAVPAPSRARETDAAMEQVDALSIKAHSVEVRAGTLSGGNQQKVVLAKWLARGADVFIFDEPTVGIDVDGRGDTYRQIRQLAEAGKGVIVVSSDFSEFGPICDRVLVMREGRVVAEIINDALTESGLVSACYADED